jgi:hypothetical protein
LVRNWKIQLKSGEKAKRMLKLQRNILKNPSNSEFLNGIGESILSKIWQDFA